ncbi:MAG TPA: DUF418 domain-containing protein [Luteimonas sp.]|nr:DUF418 domain-containing protein [Luteimonas sp.]
MNSPALTHPPATLSPIDPNDRAEWLDALRGFALLGILLANIAGFSGYAFSDPAGHANLPWNAADGVFAYLEHALIEAKFYSLFSFLFGLGFAIQLHRAEARGGDLASVFRRRMAWLLAFGLAHAFLLWFGDILNFYALMGFALLLFRKCSARTLLKWSLFFLTAPIALYVGYLAFVALTHAPPTAPPESAAGMSAIFDGYANGGYAEVVRSNAQIYAYAWIRRIYRFQLLRIFGMFLLGAWAGKIGLPLMRDALRPLLKRWLWLGLLAGLPLNFAFAALGGNDVLVPASAKGLLSITLGSVGIPLLSLGYAAAFALYWRRIRGSGHPFVASGRMALTHYLSQSAVCVALFYGIGFGLFGKTSLAISLLMALAVYLFLALLCRAWLQRYPQGPMEALWRRLSYGTRRAPAGGVARAPDAAL